MADDSASLPPIGQPQGPLGVVPQGYTLTYRVWERGPWRREPVSTLEAGPVTEGPLLWSQRLV